MPLLEAKEIIKIYSKTETHVPVLNGLDISINKCEILVLIGPSGSGKSTLLNILGTLDTDYTGNLNIDGIPISNSIDLSAIRRDRLGFVFQFHHL